VALPKETPTVLRLSWSGRVPSTRTPQNSELADASQGIVSPWHQQHQPSCITASRSQSKNVLYELHNGMLYV
jgi:hypothetical protein